MTNDKKESRPKVPALFGGPAAKSPNMGAPAPRENGGQKESIFMNMTSKPKSQSPFGPPSGFDSQQGNSTASGKNRDTRTENPSGFSLFGNKPYPPPYSGSSASPSGFFVTPIQSLNATAKSGAFGAPISQPFRTSTTSSQAVRVSKKHAIKLGSDFITIHVGDGDDQKSFAVHEALICSRSGYIKNVMNGEFERASGYSSAIILTGRLRDRLEAETEMVKLPEHDPTVFALYEQHLYTGRLPSILEPHEKDEEEEEFERLAKLFMLGEKIQDIAIKNAAVDAILERATEGQEGTSALLTPGLGTVAIIYNGTTGSCPARRLLVDLYAFRGKDDWLDDKKGVIPPGFVLDLARALLAARTVPIDNTLSRDTGFYHEPQLNNME